VIKFQAWESEYENKINALRDSELALYYRYALAQALSGGLYATLPLVTGTVTFIAYVALGNVLDVGTALTSLALFEILRYVSLFHWIGSLGPIRRRYLVLSSPFLSLPPASPCTCCRT
jgi:hypothetical protein